MAIVGPIQWKGLSAGDLPTTLAPGMCSQLSDFNVVRGALNCRINIVTSYDWGANNISDIHYWEDPASYPTLSQAAVLIMPTSSGLGKIYLSAYNESTTLLPTDRTGTAVLNGSLGGTSDSLNGIFVLCGYSTNPISIPDYSSSFAALGGSPPQAKFNKTVNNFMFLSGNTTNNSRVYWSNVIDPTTWGAANYADFRKSDGDSVTALWALNNDLLIFKHSAIGKLSTTPPSTSVSVTLGPLTTISEKIGCVGPRAVDTLPDGTIVFMSSDFCLYQFDGVVTKNLSRQSYPGPDISRSLSLIGATGTMASIVKYYPPLKAILVVYYPYAGTSISSTWMYFIDDNAWAQYSSLEITGLCMAGPTRPNVSAASAPSHRVMYTSNWPSVSNPHGHVLQLDGGNALSGNSGPTDDLGQTILAVANTQFAAGPDQFNFLPRSLILPVYGAVNRLKVKFGWDNVMNSYYSYDSSFSVPTGQFRRFIVPIAMPQSQTATIPLAAPWVLSVQVEASGSTFGGVAKIGPFYLSDELESGSTQQ